MSDPVMDRFPLPTDPEPLVCEVCHVESIEVGQCDGPDCWTTTLCPEHVAAECEVCGRIYCEQHKGAVVADICEHCWGERAEAEGRSLESLQRAFRTLFPQFRGAA